MTEDPAQPISFDPEMEGGLGGTVLRGAGIAGLGYGLTQLLTLGAYLALARLISPHDFGQFAAASILIAAGSLFAESGMLAALIHRGERVEEAASTAFVATVLGGAALALLALASSPVVGAFFHSDRVATLCAAMSGILLLRALPVVPSALLQRRFSILRRAVAEPIAVVAFGVGATIAASNDLGPWALVIGYYAGAIVDVIASWALVNWRPRLRTASYAMWRELVAYGRHVLAGTAILHLADLAPTALLGRFVGAADLGQYRYANRIAATPFSAILATGSWVLFPALARIAPQPLRFRASFLRAVGVTAAVAMPVGLILLPLGVPLAVHVFGPQWRQAGEAAMALSLFTGAASMTSVATEGFKAAGRPNLLVRSHLVAAVVGTAAMVALLWGGLVGVSAGVTIGAVASAIYSIVRAGEVTSTPLSALAREIFPPTAAALGMAAIVWAAEAGIDAEGHAGVAGLALLAAELLLAACVYVPLLMAISPRARQEARVLLSKLRPGSEEAPEISAAAADAPIATVVIPAYNGSATIAATIRSVLGQREPRLRLVVVDDGSSDNTVEIVRGFEADPRLTVIEQENQGVAAARNRGIAEADTPYVSFLDNDDLWLPTYLGSLVTALEENPRAGLAYADGWMLDDSTGRVARAPLSERADPPDPLPDDPEQLLFELARNNFVWGSVTLRRKALDQVGGFNSAIEGVDDYELWLRIVAGGWLIARPEGRQIVYRSRPDSASKDYAMMFRGIRDTVLAVAENADLPPRVRDVARGRIEGLERLIAYESSTGAAAVPRGIKRRGGVVKRRLLRGQRFHDTTPQELVDAFGDDLP